MRIRRSIIAAAAGACLALLLTGCDQFIAEPFAFTRVGDAIVVRACLDMTIDSVLIEEIGEKTHTDAKGRTVVEHTHELVWSDTREQHVVPGDEFQLGYLPPRSIDAEPHAEVVDLSADAYSVSMAVTATDGHGSWSAASHLEPASIEEGTWVDSWGDPMDPPCVHERCMPGAACMNNWPIPTGEPTRSAPTWAPEPAPTP
jgi:hypothetical protein